MADTVKIPRIGNVNKQHLFVVMGVVGSFVGYRYWKARTTVPTVIDPANATVGLNTGGFTNPAPQSPTNDSGHISSVTDEPTTNAEWSQRVISDLVTVGFDAQFVANTIGKYLDHQSLTVSEAAAIRVAWAMDGEPPEGNIPIRLVPTVPQPPSSPVSPIVPRPRPKPMPKPKPKPKPQPRRYVVKTNDMLSSIALTFYGDASQYPRIYNANRDVIERTARAHGRANSHNGDFIYPGETLVIPA
jgi:LysM domain.